MSKETEFAEGLIVKAPRAGAPDYVLGSLSIKRMELIAWLQAREGDWVNLEMKVGKSGKAYAAVDNWKPGEGKSAARPNNPGRGEDRSGDFDSEQIPF